MILYAPRLPADPHVRSECIRSFVCSLRALQAPCLGTTLGGTPPQEPHPQGHPHPPPRTPQGPPHHHHPTPPHITPPHPPPASPSGRLFQVDGYSKWVVIPSAWLFRGVILQLKVRINLPRMRSDSVTAESFHCFGGSLYHLSSHNAAPFVRIARCTQEHPKSPRASRAPRAPTNT
jgi:hypothetical protein